MTNDSSLSEVLYYELNTARSVGNPRVSKEWLSSARGTLWCEGCSRLRETAVGLNVRLQTPPVCCAMLPLFGTRVGYASTGFVEFLGDALFRSIAIIGDLCDSEGHRYDQYVTYFGRNPVIMRGNRMSERGVCQCCGEPYYISAGTPYLLASDARDARMLISVQTTILLRNEYYQTLDWRAWRKYITAYKTTVRETAIDK